MAEHGWAIATLLAPMQDEDELFASALTLGAVEDHLRAMADALGRTTPAQQQALVQLDWRGWAVLPATLQGGLQPRREATWYAINGLVPQTLELLDALRRRQPGWFGGPA